MKGFIRTLITVFTIAFAGSIIVSLYYVRHIGEEFNQAEFLQKKQTIPRYHFSIIIDNLETPFWQAFRKGVQQAVDEFNVVVEINGVNGIEEMEKSLQYLDIAVASKVDGIITYVLQKDAYIPYINAAKKEKIPVITVESDAQGSLRDCFVGTNDFELGKRAGEMMAEAADGKAQIAIILQSYVNDIYDATSNLKIEGFKDAINAYEDMEVVTIKTSSKGIFSAEDITQDIITNHPEIDAIFCTSSKDTIGTTQVIIDFNRVGDITIIGYDDLPNILDYIEKGVIYGTVVRDPRTIGYESIRTMVKILEGEYISSSITTDVDVVTKDNINQYKQAIHEMEQEIQ